MNCCLSWSGLGIDALMLVEFAGLNPMAGRLEAGCPAQNIQATLGSLTGAGLTVAVYEEVMPTAAALPNAKTVKQLIFIC